MPIPDPNENELTVELNRDLVKLLEEAKAQVKAWTSHYTRIKKQLIEELGDAFAGTVDGEKVIYYRPKEQWAVTRLEQDYPDLVAHFKVSRVVEEIDLDRFRAQHPDILDRYRVRAFVERAT